MGTFDIKEMMWARVQAHGGEKRLRKLKDKEKIALSEKLCEDVKTQPSYDAFYYANAWATLMGRPARTVMQVCALKLPDTTRCKTTWRVGEFGPLDKAEAMELATTINSAETGVTVRPREETTCLAEPEPTPSR